MGRTLLKIAGSLPLAVVLIAIDAAVLAWGTLVENQFGKQMGAAAAHFGFYDAGWFFCLNVLLAVNVLCAMLVRLPWRRRHVGFLLTHAGILVLLVGCLISRFCGIEADLPIFEGSSSHRAYVQSHHFEIQVLPGKGRESKADEGTGETPDAGNDAPNNATASAEKNVPIRTPFIAGPFPWSRYDTLSWFPWALSYRSRGKIYDADGIALEVLDYVDTPQPCVRAKLSVDGQSEEFDLIATDNAMDFLQGDQRHVVRSDRRAVSITLRPDVVDLGFQVFLREFSRKLDPGADTASHYSSRVDFLDFAEPPRRLHDDVLITLNAPVDVADPKSGHAWRFFQASFKGPFKRGNPMYDRFARPDQYRDQIYLSYLSVNYDPGRGLKYFGCLMMIVGMAVVFYFRRHAPQSA
jgi:hypothetical protein